MTTGGERRSIDAPESRAKAEGHPEEEQPTEACAAAADPPNAGGGAARPSPSIAACIRYSPDFLAREEADQLRRDVAAAKGWQELSGRRLLSLGGLVTPKGLVPSPLLPRWLPPLMSRAADRAGFAPDAPPNHALVNLYRPGEGILPHEDGPAYEPRVAIASIGSPAVLRFWRRAGPGGGGGGAAPAPVPGVDPPDASVLLEPRSLVVFEGEAYAGCYHGIEACEAETIDASVINPPPTLPPPGQGASSAPSAAAASVVLPRDGDRVSLTIRRVSRVRPLLRLGPGAG